MASTGWRENRDAGNGKIAYEKREKRRNIRKLQEAIDIKDISTVQQILDKDFDVDFRYRGQTALQLAVRLGTLEISKLLIDRGANVDEADGELNSVLNAACWNGHEDVTQLLIDSGASVDFQNDAGFTALHASAKKNHVKISGMLMAGNCSLNVPDRHGRTALLVAAQYGNGEVLAEIAAAGADVDWVDQHNVSPLMVASELGYVDIVQTLISAGANCNMQDRHGQTALLKASVNNHVIVVEVLLEHHANPDLSTNKECTPLLEAVRNNHLEIAHLLLTAGCDPNLADRLHHAPVHEAIRQVAQYFGPVQTDKAVGMCLVKQLVRAGANINMGDNQGWRPLYQAAHYGNLELTELLLKSGADLTVLTSNDDTIMHAAVYGNSESIVNVLVRAGCSVNGANKDLQNPLTAGIISHSDIKILSALVKAGADLNLAERISSHTPLHEAINQHYNEAAILLIDSGCNLMAQNKHRQSPLCMACEKANEPVVRHLLGALPRPLKFTTLSAIPLHAAAKHGHAHILKLLVDSDCDINQLNLDGLTALQVATMEDYFRAARCLLQMGCDPDAHARVTTLLKCCLQNEDPHPHFALEPLFHAVTHRNLDLIRLLVQCYSVTPIRVIKLLKVILKTSHDLTAHYDPVMKHELLTIFDINSCRPKSLQDVCRRKIRASLGFCITKKVQMLPVAQKIKDYITMKDLFDSWDEDDRIEEELHGRHSVFGWRGSMQ